MLGGPECLRLVKGTVNTPIFRPSHYRTCLGRLLQELRKRPPGTSASPWRSETECLEAAALHQQEKDGEDRWSGVTGTQLLGPPLKESVV